jgi:hypothetical protein
MNISKLCIEVFQQCVKNYHVHDHVDHPINNPYEQQQFEHLLYLKNQIDTVQWHLEDIVRDPNIDPLEGIALKRRIDRSNQERTDLVEKIDDYFLHLFKDVVVSSDAKVNTESPAWAIDRLSILALKIWHMQEEVNRKEADETHRQKCEAKLTILLEQQVDLSTSIDELLADIEAGRKKMKVYRQMKMYNDPSLNPVLYHLAQKQS